MRNASYMLGRHQQLEKFLNNHVRLLETLGGVEVFDELYPVLAK